MAIEPRIFVRARQRSRTALPPLTNPLEPGLSEVGVDRLEIGIGGRWRVLGSRHSQMQSLQDYADLLEFPIDCADWFRRPEWRYNIRTLQTRTPSASTLGIMAVKLRGSPGATEGALSISITTNPTRTLAHLLAEHGSRSNFCEHISAFPPSQFFAPTQEHIERAFGTPDNWFPDFNLLRDQMGQDPFARFLPIFVGQIQQFVLGILRPRLETPTFDDGTDIVIRDPDIEVRLDWGHVKVPQIETYFERHFSQAVGAVRSAATVALADLNRTRVSRYSVQTSHWVERQDDCLVIGTPLTDRHALTVYAKSKSRIRFEVKRLKKGDYSGLARPSSPTDWLLDILNLERRNLLAQVRWQAVAQMFHEPDRPILGDLSRLCQQVAQACMEDGVEVGPVLGRLLEDGGLLRSGLDNIPADLIARLCEMGVLKRTTVRRRDIGSNLQRLSLNPEFRVLIETIIGALAVERDDAAN